MGHNERTGVRVRYNGICLDDYTGWEIADIINKWYDAKESYESIVAQLYSKDKLDKENLVCDLETLGEKLDVKIPSEELQIEKKNESLQQIQFLLGKVLT